MGGSRLKDDSTARQCTNGSEVSLEARSMVDAREEAGRAYVLFRALA